jgi:hypothetical protein
MDCCPRLYVRLGDIPCCSIHGGSHYQTSTRAAFTSTICVYKDPKVLHTDVASRSTSTVSSLAGWQTTVIDTGTMDSVVK